MLHFWQYGRYPDDFTILRPDEGDVLRDILCQQLNQVRYRQQLISAGDVNVRIGIRNQDEIIGRFGETRINDSDSSHFINTCKQHDLKICNLLFFFCFEECFCFVSYIYSFFLFRIQHQSKTFVL